MLALLAVGLAPSCSGTYVQADEAFDCRDATLAEVCPKAGCRTLDEEVAVSESLCERGFDSFVKVLSHGCGVTEVKTLDGYSNRSKWFDSASGELVGFTWGSDTDPECNGTFYGTKRGEGCDSVTTEPCSICGWNVCEWTACTDEVTACAFGIQCGYLWRCAMETGCHGEECVDETICPGISTQYASMASQALDSLQACLADAVCPDACPLSLKL